MVGVRRVAYNPRRRVAGIRLLEMLLSRVRKWTETFWKWKESLRVQTRVLHARTHMFTCHCVSPLIWS